MKFATKWLDGGDLQERAELDINNFDFVGITERLDDSMKLLKVLIPELMIEIGAHRLNPDKAVGEPYVLNPDDERKLSDQLAPLIFLYEEAVKRFESDCEAMNMDKFKANNHNGIRVKPMRKNY